MDGKDNDFSSLQGRRFSLDRGPISTEFGCGAERGAKVGHLAVVIRSIQVGDQAGLPVIGQLAFLQLVPCEFDIVGKQQGHETVFAEVGAPDAAVGSGQFHIHIVGVPPDVHRNDGDTEVNPSTAVGMLVAVFDIVKSTKE